MLLQKLIYVPWIPRLQTLFRNPTLSKLMVWHVENKNKMEIMNEPKDGCDWRHVDTTWPEFGSSPRDVLRLGLSTYGVNPFSQQQTNHST